MIFPCIDLMDGKVVQLIQGREKALEGDSPEAMLTKFAAFPEIQVIDLDAAMGRGSNGALVEMLAAKAVIRAGGGVRTAERFRALIAQGAHKVIVGTSAFTKTGINETFLASLDRERTLIALDSKGGRIVIRGWQESTAFTAEEVLHSLEPYCSGFLCTYVDKEGMLQGTDLDWFRRLRAATSLELTAAGGITTMDDVRALLDMNVHAALGMAIYTGRLSLEEVARASRPASLTSVSQARRPALQSAIEAADTRIRPFVRETPVKEFRPGVFLKLEHLQRTGSFKIRGASNKIALLTPDQAAAGVVTASNGNHGLGVAAAARSRGIAAEVFVSSHVSPAKAQRIESLGARIHPAGDDPLTAELAARRAAETSGRIFISPYNDLDVMAGQGTIAVELHRQIPNLDAVLAAVGGGGLIGGIGSYLKAVSPQTEIVGCWPENSPVMLECMRAGRVVEVAEQPTLSESTAGGLEADSVTLEVCRRVIDRSILVTEDEILSAMRLILETGQWLIEGAAAVAVAAYLKEAPRYEGKRVAIVICGRNLSPEVHNRLLLSSQS